MKQCTECWHWYFDGGSEGYSDLTPGTDGEVGCNKGLWPGRRRRFGQMGMLRFYDLDQDMFREYLAKAETCPQFADRASTAPDAGLTPAAGTPPVDP
jgi:hypothetical protein